MKSHLLCFLLVFIQCSVTKYGTQHPSAPEQTKQFGQLVGKWNCISEDLAQDGTWQTSKAIWTFKYTLDGFAIEDIWFERANDKTNNTATLGRDFTGINYRIYNPQFNNWQCVWLDNRANTMSAVWTAEQENDQIRMHDGTGNWHIIFFNITSNRFDWKYEVKQSDDSWKLMSKIVATRH